MVKMWRMDKRGKGRPTKPKKERRTNILRIRLKPIERETLEEASKNSGLDVSAWSRDRLLAQAKREIQKLT